MIKRLRYLLYAGVFIAALSACSDELSPIDELSETIYDPSVTGNATLDKRINAFYDKYGSKILYDFPSSDLWFGWSSDDVKWYVPVKKEGSEPYIEKIIDVLEGEDVLGQYPSDFVKKYFPFRVFLVDSICDAQIYKENKLRDVLELKTHGIAIAHISKDMDELDEDAWGGIKTAINTSLMNSIFSAIGTEPTEFLDSNDAGFINEIESDPEGEFTDFEYTCYKATIVTGEVVYEEYVMGPGDEEDFGSYVAFIMQNGKTKLDRVFERFPVVKARATLAYKFMFEKGGTDLIEFQNKTYPDDSLPSGYFTK